MVGTGEGTDGFIPERRQLTVVFVDIIDATSLSERLDPEEFFAILSAYRELCDERIRRYGGHIARTVGDGLLAYFGLPRAHEDDAERAVHAALSIATGMHDRQFPLTEHGSLRLRVRIAVNTGIVVVGGTTGEFGLKRRDVFGTPVHIAARLQNIAPANGVVIGSTTHELVSRAFKCAYLGQHAFKGVSLPVRAWRIEAVADSESRFDKTRAAPLSSMIGRTFEHTRLLELWARAAAGSGGAVVVSGDPGIGKSRLIREFRTSLPNTVVETLYHQCAPLHTATPLAPEIDRLKRAAGLRDGDTAAQMIAKLRRLLKWAISDTDDALRYYGALLSIPACEGYTPAILASPRERERTLQTLMRVLLMLSRVRPVLMIVEDAQWIDPTSIELLERIIPSITCERILLVITHRSDYVPAWLSGRAATMVPLTKLSIQESEQLVRTLAGNASFPRRVLRKIVDRTDGVPLFIEEVTRTVLESGLPATNEGRPPTGDSSSELLLPASIHDSLAERLDHLGDAKRIAQFASVFGRQFELEGLHFVSDISRDELLQTLRKLETAGLLRQQHRTSDETFAFNHAMIQEAAYGSMLKEERRQLHARATSWLKGLGRTRDSGQLAVLGHHYSRAGMLSDAIGAFLSAGKLAMNRSAYKEAIANLAEGVDLVSKLPDSPQRFKLEIALHSHLAMAHAAMGGWWHPQVDRAYGRALELCRNHGTVREKSIVLWGMTMAQLVKSELLQALDYAQELLVLANASGDGEAALMAHTGNLVVNFFLGRLSEAQSSASFVRQRYKECSHSKLVQIYQHDPEIVAFVYAGQIEWLLGYPSKGRGFCDDARRLARGLKHPFMLAFALILGSSDHLYERNYTANLACVQEGIALAKEHTLPLFEVFGPLWATPALARRDPSGAILEELSGLISKLLENKYYLQAPLYQSLLASEFGRIGAVERGRCLTSSAERLMKQTGERWFEPEVYRVRASLLSREPHADPGAAVEYFVRALESARTMRTVGWELRVAISFANFLSDHGKVGEALKILAETRSKFPTEESSADLQESDLLLHHLRT